MKNKKIIPIFFSSDKNYVPYLTVAIKSLINHVNSDNIYMVYILSADLKNCDIQEIKHFEKDNVTISIVDVNEKIKDIKDKVAL